MKYIVRKLGWLMVALYVAVTINFILPRLMPGDPGVVLANRLQNVSAPSIESIRVAFGLETDQSLFHQYASYLMNIATLDLGISLSYYPTKVTNVLEKALFWTIGLLGIATVFSFISGSLIGIFIAYRREKILSSVTLSFFLFLRSFPYFWLGLICVYLFAFELDLFPLGGGYSFAITKNDGWEYLLSMLYHGILPGFTIVLSSMGYWMLMIRNNMINVLTEDYILVATAKGIPPRQIALNYAARNAMLPSISGFALALGFILGGSLVTEIVFSYPGIGFTLYQAVHEKDYPLLQGIFLLITSAILFANFLSDMGLMILDPRVKE